MIKKLKYNRVIAGTFFEAGKEYDLSKDQINALDITDFEGDEVEPVKKTKTVKKTNK